MQETVYKCDWDKKEIGDIPHITLGLNKGLSGIAVPPRMPKNADNVQVLVGELAGLKTYWHVHKVPTGFMHFCSPEHMKLYFAKLLKESKTQK